jgi:hypothetical protein
VPNEHASTHTMSVHVHIHTHVLHLHMHSQAEGERKAKEAAEKERQRVMAEELKQANDFIEKLQQSMVKNDLKSAREFADKAKGHMVRASGDVSRVEKMLASIAEKERQVLQEQEREKERQKRELEAQAERERSLRSAEGSLESAKKALSSGDVKTAKRLVQEANALFTKGGQNGAASTRDLEALVKAREEEEERKERQRMQEEEARKEARRQELLRQGHATANVSTKASQTALQILEKFKDVVLDEAKMRTAALQDILQSRAQALEHLNEADRQLEHAKSLYAQANDNGGSVVSQAAASCRDARMKANLVASKVAEEDTRRQMEMQEQQRQRELRHKKRKECPIPPANLDATAGWGTGAVYPRAVKRRDARSGMTVQPLPLSGAEIHAQAQLLRQMRTRLVANAQTTLDVCDAVCETLAAYVQVRKLQIMCSCLHAKIPHHHHHQTFSECPHDLQPQ